VTAPILTKEQRSLFEAIDTSVTCSLLSGFRIHPSKITAWKRHVLDGMSADDLIRIIQADRNKGVQERPAGGVHLGHPDANFPSYPGMKSMGNGYYISGDEPAELPVK
jgi:hypothetical protein